VRSTAPVPSGPHNGLRQTLKKFEDSEDGVRMTFESIVKIEGSDRPALITEDLNLVFDWPGVLPHGGGHSGRGQGIRRTRRAHPVADGECGAFTGPARRHHAGCDSLNRKKGKGHDGAGSARGSRGRTVKSFVTPDAHHGHFAAPMRDRTALWRQIVFPVEPASRTRAQHFRGLVEPQHHPGKLRGNARARRAPLPHHDGPGPPSYSRATFNNPGEPTHA